MRRLKMHPLTLRFDDAREEQRFQVRYFSVSLPLLRIVLWVGIILNLFNAVFIDSVLIQEHLVVMRIFRYFFLTPILVVQLILLYRRPRSAWLPFTLTVSALIIGFSFILLLITFPAQRVIYFSLVVITLILALFIMLNVRYIYITLVGWILIFTHLAVLHTVRVTQEVVGAYLTLTFLLVGFLGTFNAYMKERLARHEYLRMWVLERERRRLRRLNRRLKRTAILDELTGLYNRRYLVERLNEMIYLVERYEKTAGVILLDLDNFKELNDEYGHLIGDNILRAVAGQLRRLVRRSDTVYRFGGDEFVILLPETDLASSVQMAQRLVKSIRVVEVEELPHLVPISCSAGVSVISAVTETVEDVMRAVDRALYRAKWQGKGRVSWLEPKTTESA